MSYFKHSCQTALILAVCQFVPASFAAADDVQDLVALEQQGEALSAAGKFRQATEVGQRMVTFAEQRFQHDPEYIGHAWNGLAGHFLNLEAYEQAHQAASKSLTTFEKTLGPQHNSVAEALTNLANAQWGLNRHAEALAGHQRALTIRQRTKGAESREAADTLENLAVVHADLGRHVDAEPYYRQALAIKTKLFGSRHEGVAQLHYNLGNGYLEQRRLDLAEAHFKRALDLYETLRGPDHWMIFRVATHLSRVYKLWRRFPEAEVLVKRAAGIALQVYGPDAPSVAANHELADLYLPQDRFAEAEPIYRRALAFYEAHPEQDQGDSSIVLDALARVYAGQKLWDKSLQASDQCIAKLSGNENSARLNHLYLRRAITRAELGRRDALEDFHRAIELSEGMRSGFSGDDVSRAESFVLFGHAYFEAAKYHLREKDAASALRELERARARSLIDQMNAAHVDLLAGVSAEQARALHQAQTKAEIQLASLEKQWQALAARRDLSKSENDAQQKQLSQSLVAARQQVAEAHTALRNASPAYRQAVGRDFQPVGLAALEDWLRQRQSLMLYYVDLPDECYVLSIGRAGAVERTALTVTAAQAAVLGVDAGPLDHNKLRLALVSKETGVLPKLADPRRAAQTTDQLAALWQVLIPEADRMALTAGTHKSVTIITCPSLFSLPFETLVTATEPEAEYFLDSGPPVLYAPSATILLNLAGQRTPAVTIGRPPILTVGDPAYDSGSKISRLPFTATESHWVKEAYAKQGQTATQLLTTGATENAVRSQIAGRRIVHLACHGVAQESYGNLFGSLILAPGQRNLASDDGALTLGEIYSLDLRGCELAILSACQTNYGPQQLGEGGWALTRGFLVAGSRRVVSSNWVVDDKAAATLIYFFANSIAQHKESGSLDHALALQKAKRAIRKKDEWQSPYYWGPFVLVGPN